MEFARIGNAGKDYPVCSLGNGVNIDRIELHFLHYSDYEECAEKWRDRCDRIQWDRILLLFTDQNHCTLNDIENFLKVPDYPKLLFIGELDTSSLTQGQNERFIRVAPTKKEQRKNENPVDHCMLFNGFTGKRRYERNAEIVEFMESILEE